MAGFDEDIVREYFELHGFLVRQIRKYQVQSRKKLAEEEIDLLVLNPACDRSRKPGFLIFSSELPHISRAVVVVKGWHSSTHFTPAMLTRSAEILRFLEKNVMKKAGDFFAVGNDATDDELADIQKILVLPGIPTNEPHRSQAVELLKEKGLDGVISFRSILLDLFSKVDTNRNYQKSELLQILRILKNYDLIKEPQLELFPGSK